MKPSSSKASHLFESIKEVANLIQSNSPSATQNIKFHIHNSHKGEWDEVWLLREEAGTTLRQPFIRVSLSGLSNAERTELTVLVSHHNTNRWSIKAMLRSMYLHAKNQLCKLQLPVIPLKVSSDEI